MLEIDRSASAVGLVLAAGSVTFVGSLLVGGVIADRVSRRRVMVAADLLRLVSQGGSAALVLSGQAEVWSLAALAAVTGVGTGFFWPASTGLLPSVVEPGQLVPANGLRTTVGSAAEIGGPAVAGVIVALWNPGIALAVDAATFALSAALLIGMRPRRVAPRERSSFLADLKGGWGAFTSRQWLWVIVGAASVGNLAWAAWNTLGPVLAGDQLGGAAGWGAVLSAMGVGALGAGLLATQLRPRRPLVLFALTGLGLAAPIVALAAGASIMVVAAGAFISGALMTVGDAVWEATLQRHIPEETLSRVSSYDWFGSMIFYPLGYVFWGPIAGVAGEAAALWIAAGLVVFTAAAMLLSREVRTLGSEPEEPPAVTVPAGG